MEIRLRKWHCDYFHSAAEIHAQIHPECENM